jgi:F0F1-type ATP synthase membrane subunit b/b'
MAEKLIRGSINTDVHKKLIDSCIQDLENLDS